MPLPGLFWPALQTLVGRLRGQKILWAITGSTAFALRGLPFTPKDIDVQTDAAGAYALETALEDFVLQPVGFSGTDRIRSHFGRLQVGGVKVEIMGDVEKWVNGRWEPPPDLLQHREIIQLEGMNLPVLSLKYELAAYQKMGREQTVAILQQWLGGEKFLF